MILHKYTDADLPFIEEVLSYPEVAKAFPYWQNGLPDFNKFLMYVENTTGFVIGEALGGGEYLSSVAVLPSKFGALAGQIQRIGIDKAMLETDCIRVYANVNRSCTLGLSNTLSFGLDTYCIDDSAFAGSVDFIKWASTSKTLRREAVKFYKSNNVNINDIPHGIMLYACLKASANGWGMKVFNQWYRFQRMATDVDNLIPLDETFHYYFYEGVIVTGLDGEPFMPDKLISK